MDLIGNALTMSELVAYQDGSVVSKTLIDKKEKKLAVNWDDELVKATLLTRDGAVVNPNFKPKAS